MKYLITIALFVLSFVGLTQAEIRPYNMVIDYDGYKKREYRIKGEWISTDTTLIKIDSGYQLDKNLVETKGNTRVYINDWNEEVHAIFMPNGDVVIRNQSNLNQYTIYRFKKSS